MHERHGQKCFISSLPCLPQYPFPLFLNVGSCPLTHTRTERTGNHTSQNHSLPQSLPSIWEPISSWLDEVDVRACTSGGSGVVTLLCVAPCLETDREPLMQNGR